jgi:hypothetical protein
MRERFIPASASARVRSSINVIASAAKQSILPLRCAMD